MVAGEEYHGKYVGKVKTEWLPDGRNMRLLEPFVFIDSNGAEWAAPTNSITDGASIPKACWSFIGGPFEGKYREAAVIHDVACENQKRSWESTHETFYHAMLVSGTSIKTAKKFYWAVYHYGPRWEPISGARKSRVLELGAVSERQLSESDFATVNKYIEEKENSGYSMSLEEIRSYQPSA
jgi:hypothetical protein